MQEAGDGEMALALAHSMVPDLILMDVLMPKMAELYRLARLGNMQEIIKRTAYLVELDKRYQPLSKQLCTLAKGYQSKAALKLVKQHIVRDEAQQDASG